MNTQTQTTYVGSKSNPEPKKEFRYVRLTDSTGEQLEGVVETQESMKARLAWSKTAGPDQFRSFDLFMLDRSGK